MAAASARPTSAMPRHGLAIILLACTIAAATASKRVMKLQITSSTQANGTTREIRYNPATDHTPIDTDISSWLVKTAYGLTPEQVSVNYWAAPGTYLFSWVTGDAQVGLGLKAPATNLIASTVTISTSVNLTNPSKFSGSAVTYTYNYSGYAGYYLMDYASGVIHHTLVSGLNPGTTYYYTVGDDNYGTSKVYNFSTLPHQLPLKISVIADTGQTRNTSDTINQLLAFSTPQLVLNIGDLSYADNFDSRGTYACWLTQVLDAGAGAPFFAPNANGSLTAQCQQDLPPEKMESADTYQPKFDSWARLFEQVFAYFPTMHTNGNHEMDIQADGTMFAGYNARYPQPQNPNVINTNPINFFSDKGDDNLYSMATIPGVATVFMLTTFQPYITFGSSADNQFSWLEANLKTVNRSATPWLLVGFHVPIYTTDPNSFKVGECFRLAYEPLFYKYGVDIILNGHVHAYERTYPVYNYTLDPCGPVHLIVGSGGNNEGLSAVPGGWIDEQANTTSWCADPKSRQWPDYQPQRCFSYQSEFSKYSNYCPDKQPEWEAFRYAAFGSGLLTLQDANTAVWEWHSNLAGVMKIVDQATITRGRDNCTAQRR